MGPSFEVPRQLAARRLINHEVVVMHGLCWRGGSRAKFLALLLVGLVISGSGAIRADAADATIQLNEAPLGCFKDQGDPQGTAGRDLSGSMFSSATMTNATCRSQCGARGFGFAGTQYGSYCFCGDDYGKSGRSNDCNMPCSGSLAEICGGAWANTVYASTKPTSATIAQPPRDLPRRQPPAQPPPASPPLLLPSAAPPNGGQCVIDVRAPNYSSREIQRWEVTGSGVSSPPAVLYPLRWSTSGNGSSSGSAGTTTWSISGLLTTQLRVQTLPAGTWLIQLNSSQLIVPRGIRVLTPNGQTDSAAAAFGYPPISAPGTQTRIDEYKTFPIAAGLSYQQPGNATGQVTCEWHVTP